MDKKYCDESVVYAGCFETRISGYDDNGFYQLHIDTTPDHRLLDTGKNFRTVENAKRYYLRQLKKILNEALDDISIRL